MELPPSGQQGDPAARHARRDGADPVVLRCEPLGHRAGVKVIGEIDFTVRTEWEDLLESMTAGSADVYLDLSDVRFSDASATAALVRTAHRIGPSRRVVVDRPPTTLLHLLDLLWPEGTPTIEVQAR